jgi:hypothetical protein
VFVFSEGQHPVRVHELTCCGFLPCKQGSRYAPKVACVVQFDSDWSRILCHCVYVRAVVRCKYFIRIEPLFKLYDSQTGSCL